MIDLGSEHLVAERTGSILRVRIDRTERRNAMSQAMYRGVKRAAILADRDPEIDALCLTGTDDVFSVGGDMGGGGRTPDESLASELDPTDHFPFRHLERCSKAVVAAVNGHCHAGGLNLVLFADLAVAADGATFRAPELLRGAPDAWMSARLADHVGVGRAKYLMFTAVTLSAAEAATMGLVARVAPPGRFDRTVDEVLAEVVRCAPGARAAVKDDINRALRPPDTRIFQRSITSPEMREGMAAFVEKRPAVWPRGRN